MPEFFCRHSCTMMGRNGIRVPRMNDNPATWIAPWLDSEIIPAIVLGALNDPSQHQMTHPRRVIGSVPGSTPAVSGTVARRQAPKPSNRVNPLSMAQLLRQQPNPR